MAHTQNIKTRLVMIGRGMMIFLALAVAWIFQWAWIDLLALFFILIYLLFSFRTKILWTAAMTFFLLVSILWFMNIPETMPALFLYGLYFLLVGIFIEIDAVLIMAIALLFSIPVILIFNQEALAELLATHVYFLLVVAGMLFVRAYRHEH